MRRGMLPGVPRPRWSNVVVLLGAAGVPAAVAPWCGGVHWSLDLLASFVVQATGWLTLCAAALLIARRWRWAAAAAGFGAIGASVFVPGWCVDPAQPGQSFPGTVENSSRVQVLALNLLRDNENGHDAALEAIRAAAPDLIYCTEYTPHWQAYLRSQLGDFPHRLERVDPGYFGAALFSRWPLREAAFVPLGQEWTPAARAIVATPGGTLGVLGVHPPPPGPSRARVAARDAGVLAIAPALAPLPPARVVLGDFNATPWQAAFPTMRAAAGLGAGSTDRWRPTWPAQLPLPLRIPIDHVLVGGPVDVEAVSVGAPFGSDHLPVSASLVLRRATPPAGK